MSVTVLKRNFVYLCCLEIVHSLHCKDSCNVWGWYIIYWTQLEPLLLRYLHVQPYAIVDIQHGLDRPIIKKPYTIPCQDKHIGTHIISMRYLEIDAVYMQNW